MDNLFFLELTFHQYFLPFSIQKSHFRIDNHNFTYEFSNCPKTHRDRERSFEFSGSHGLQRATNTDKVCYLKDVQLYDFDFFEKDPHTIASFPLVKNTILHI